MATEDDPATKRDLVQLEERLTERFTGRLQQTQADVQLQMRDMQQQMRDMQQQMRDMQAETQQQMRDMKAELQEQMRDMQTELLKAFLPWHDNVGIQFRELEVNTGNTLQAVKERIGILERRLQQIERKLLLEPPAA